MLSREPVGVESCEIPTRSALLKVELHPFEKVIDAQYCIQVEMTSHARRIYPKFKKEFNACFYSGW